MSSNKKDITFRQNEERKELMKIKKGQYAEPVKAKKSEPTPMTSSERIKNFWYYKKTIIIIALILAAGIALMISQCRANIDYDFQVVVYTSDFVLDSQAPKIEEYFEKYGKDLNGDGEVNVAVINCSYDKNSGDKEYEYQVKQKLVGQLSASDKSLLYITDSESMEELKKMSDTDIFEGEPYLFGEEFYSQTVYEEDGTTYSLKEGLQLSCRCVKGTVIEKYDNADKVYAESKRILQELAKVQG